eukprot:m.31405 g.31405  ORF g.31405 m.31405 type:complete len:74 (-) comp16452_c0_seq1:1788-2009(-)
MCVRVRACLFDMQLFQIIQTNTSRFTAWFNNHLWGSRCSKATCSIRSFGESSDVVREEARVSVRSRSAGGGVC